MKPPGFDFQLQHVDAGSEARRSTLTTPRGKVDLPAFMPVGTQGTVKGLLIDQVRSTGAQMILGNTYHLELRPGSEIIRQLNGLHAFTGWDGPILTDSGGFQLFSLAKLSTITEEGAIFRSHIDGSLVELTPERAIRIQESLGSDIAMVLDHVVALPNETTVVADACWRTVRWAQRCQEAASTPDRQIQFAIVQGGLDFQLRRECAEMLIALDFPGYAIGGLSVGEEPAKMVAILEATCPVLPVDRPRYLMGVGRPEDLLHSIAQGVDMFDCVMPTRNGRNALAFTDRGKIRLRNKQYQTDSSPIEEGCPCPACRHGRGYLRHLFVANEMLGPILLSAHNLTYYQRLMSEARVAIEEDRYSAFVEGKIRDWARC